MKRSFLPSQLSQLPASPGVYRFYDRTKRILYVGKATSLRSRVSSYWQRPHDERIALMVKDIRTIRITPTDSVFEALILEANEIKRLQPPFNIMQKDDKSFTNIVITDETFPQILVQRPTDRKKWPAKRVFGPYLSAFSARTALKILRRIFPYRCNRPISSGRACLYYHLGLCPGTCIGTITVLEYRHRVQHIVDILSGKRVQVMRDLKREMKAASKARQYERAARLRDQLRALEHIHDVALMTNREEASLARFPIRRIEAYDISLAAGRDAVGSMIVLRHGVPAADQYRRFKIRSVTGANDIAMLAEVLSRRLKHTEWELPDLFIIDGGIPQRNIARRTLEKAGLRSAPVLAVAKGPERKKAEQFPTAAAERLIRKHAIRPDEVDQIIRRARDEAHRFAITYHRLLRSKRMHT